MYQDLATSSAPITSDIARYWHSRGIWAPWKENRITAYPAVSEVVVSLMLHADAVHNVEMAEKLKKIIQDEWPTPAQDDPAMMAYTRSDEHGVEGRRTKTSVGKWINRHFPKTFGGRAIDALIAAHNGVGESLIWLDTVEEMVDHMVTARDKGCSFGSCMTASHLPKESHPYRVYAPSLGWRMALLISGDAVVARALVNGSEYVRAYGKDSNKICSMSRALDVAGIEHVGSWDGCEIRAMKNGNGDYDHVGPYLDGSAQTATLKKTEIGYVFVIEEDGTHDFTNTNGYTSLIEDDHEGQIQLSNGDWIDEDDAHYVERYGEYFHSDEVCWTDDDETELIEDCVYLECGDYTYKDNAVKVGRKWYRKDDTDNIVYSDYENEYLLTDDAVWSEDEQDYISYDDAVEVDGDWYPSDSYSIIEVDGEWYVKGNEPVKAEA